jgi:hypothetical protein
MLNGLGMHSSQNRLILYETLQDSIIPFKKSRSPSCSSFDVWNSCEFKSLQVEDRQRHWPVTIVRIGNPIPLCNIISRMHCVGPVSCSKEGCGGTLVNDKQGNLTFTFESSLLSDQVFLSCIGDGHEAGIDAEPGRGTCRRKIVVKCPRVPY